MEKYKNHEYAKEICRACGRLLYEILPEDKKEEIGKLVNNRNLDIESVIEEANHCYSEKDFEKALTLIEGAVAKVEEMREAGWFIDDSVSEYHDFFNPIEEVLFKVRNKPEKTVRQFPEPYAQLYLNYGSILFELGRIDEARVALEKARLYNPINPKIIFEYLEIYKAKGELEFFAQMTRETFRLAYSSSDLARCFRNLGYYFVEKELWRPAMVCYELSLAYDKESDAAIAELYYINNRTGGIPRSTVEEARALAEQYDFPMGPDDDVIGIAITIGKRELERENGPAARYFLEIVYDLTENEDVKEMLEKAENLCEE